MLAWALNNRYIVGGTIYLPTIGELIHFLSETRYHHVDDILSGVRDHNIEFDNITVAWDGDSLLDILWWQAKEVLKKL